MTSAEVADFERCVAGGGVVLFPADTVYGLATDPESPEGVERLYELKGRRPDVPAAVMFFDLGLALAALPELDERTRAAVERLLPGALTVLLPNPEGRYPLAGGGKLGLRVPRLEGELEPLRGMGRPVLQSSANPSGGADARRLEHVDPSIRAGVDQELDGGELPGTPSTVVDLSALASAGTWEVVREGAVSEREVAEAI